MGKTAIAEGLAQKIVSGDVPELLQGGDIADMPEISVFDIM